MGIEASVAAATCELLHILTMLFQSCQPDPCLLDLFQ